MNRKKSISKKVLPFRWRDDVREILAAKGFDVDLQKISNIKTGRVIDEILTPLVADALTQVKEKYQKLKALAEAL